MTYKIVTFSIILGPKFTNCPTGVVEIDVTRDSLMAALTTNLEARDCEGRVVPVRISTTVLRWRPDMKPYPVTAGAMDQWGNAVTCKFLVRVRGL